MMLSKQGKQQWLLAVEGSCSRLAVCVFLWIKHSPPARFASCQAAFQKESIRIASSEGLNVQHGKPAAPDSSSTVAEISALLAVDCETRTKFDGKVQASNEGEELVESQGKQYPLGM